MDDGLLFFDIWLVVPTVKFSCVVDILYNDVYNNTKNAVVHL